MTKLQWLKIQIPLLTVYFITGLVGITAVTNTFLKQEFFQLSSIEWSVIAVWAGFPWSMKILYATFIDGISVFGSRRKSYLILGAGTTSAGILLSSVPFSLPSLEFSHFLLLSLGAVLTSSGIVIMDIVADTLAVDIVPNTGDRPEYQKNLGRIAVNSRIALMLGAIVAAVLSAVVAKALSPTEAYLLAAALPLLVIISVFTFPVLEVKSPPVIKKSFFALVLGFSTLTVLMSFLLPHDYSQPLLFIFSMAFIIYLAKDFLKDIDKDLKKSFIFATLAVFLFRVIPGPTEPLEWWMIKELGLDRDFFGTLRIIATVSGFGVLVLAKNWVARANVLAILIVFTIADLILNLPTLAAYYGLGDPKKLILLETALASPLANLAMIPLHILLAQFAPVQKRAIYLAVTAAFVNLALTAGNLVTKALNSVFIVTQDDFSQLGNLLWASLGISLLFSLIGIALLLWGNKK